MLTFEAFINVKTLKRPHIDVNLIRSKAVDEGARALSLLTLVAAKL